MIMFSMIHLKICLISSSIPSKFFNYIHELLGAWNFCSKYPQSTIQLLSESRRNLYCELKFYYSCLFVRFRLKPKCRQSKRLENKLRGWVKESKVVWCCSRFWSLTSIMCFVSHWEFVYLHKQFTYFQIRGSFYLEIN